MKTFILLIILCHGTFGVKHYLQYFLTASSGLSDFPEFVAFSMLDGIQGGYCDSRGERPKPKQDWAKHLIKDNPQLLEWYGQGCVHYQYSYRAQIDMLKQQMNQTEGVHIFQRIRGCEWDDETGESNGFNQFGYDGEDFIAFDPKTLTWVAAKPQAVITKHKWDRDLTYIELKRIFYAHGCPERLKKYLKYLKSFLPGAERPTVSLLQKTPSSPVSCHATGFYPDTVQMFWRKDGEKLYRDVDPGETLPNHDGTFQVTVDLNISSVELEDWGKYDCVFRLSGVMDDIVTRLDKAAIRTNWVSPAEFPSGPVIGVVVGLLLLFTAGLCFWKRKYYGFRTANISDPSSPGT